MTTPQTVTIKAIGEEECISCCRIAVTFSSGLCIQCSFLAGRARRIAERQAQYRENHPSDDAYDEQQAWEAETAAMRAHEEALDALRVKASGDPIAERYFDSELSRVSNTLDHLMEV